MTWSDTFQIATAVIASIGGTSALVFALSSWLGKIWASRILEREKAELNRSIEVTKAELVRSIEVDKAALTAFLDEHRSELHQLVSERLDALNRRRDIYARLATKMRVLVRTDMPSTQREAEQWAFLAAYDEGYVWASEAVATAIHDLVAALEEKTKADKDLKLLPPNAPSFAAASASAKQWDKDAKALYQRCLLEMRKDSGFSATQVGYRVVSF